MEAKTESPSCSETEKTKRILFYPDYARCMLNKGAEKIPRLLAEWKKGNLAYFVMDELVVKLKPLGSDELNFFRQPLWNHLGNHFAKICS